MCAKKVPLEARAPGSAALGGAMARAVHPSAPKRRMQLRFKLRVHGLPFRLACAATLLEAEGLHSRVFGPRAIMHRMRGASR